MQPIIYDGSFGGFLTAIFEVYEYGFNDVRISPPSRHRESLFAEPHRSVTKTAKAARVWEGLKKKLPASSLSAVYRSFLSGLPEMEARLLEFVRYVFKSNGSVAGNFANEAVRFVHETDKKVRRERHRMTAFIRFRKSTDGLFFATIEPDFDVLPLIVRHFESRYADQRWLIYDTRRHYGIYYDLEKTEPVEISLSAGDNGGVELAEGELLYQELWQRYFSSVNIQARKNTRLHIRHVPKRYWKYLTEKLPDTSRLK